MHSRIRSAIQEPGNEHVARYWALWEYKDELFIDPTLKEKKNNTDCWLNIYCVTEKKKKKACYMNDLNSHSL